MSDDALLAWLESGAKPDLDSEALAARRRVAFSQRFLAALALEDMGPTQELHDAAVAAAVLEIHDELRTYGIDEYDQVWQLMSAPTRAAIKRCVAGAKENK